MADHCSTSFFLRRVYLLFTIRYLHVPFDRIAQTARFTIIFPHFPPRSPLDVFLHVSSALNSIGEYSLHVFHWKTSFSSTTRSWTRNLPRVFAAEPNAEAPLAKRTSEATIPGKPVMTRGCCPRIAILRWLLQRRPSDLRAFRFPGEPNFAVPDDDEFYQKFLRPCKWYAKSAFQLVSRCLSSVFFFFSDNVPRESKESNEWFMCRRRVARNTKARSLIHPYNLRSIFEYRSTELLCTD